MPGAALLVTAGAGVPMAEGVGAFMVCAVLITRAGAAGWFARVMNRIPQALASALLAGVAAQRAAGYATPVSPVITTTGIATLLLALAVQRGRLS